MMGLVLNEEALFNGLKPFAASRSHFDKRRCVNAAGN
jgi:hypothetical protein